MKALIYTAPQMMAFGTAPLPKPAQGEALVQVAAAGICGSDMHAYLGHDDRRPAPLILGHEAAGVIADGPETGRRVTINPLVTCGSCDFCTSGRSNLCTIRQIISMPPRPGAFAQYVAMPLRNLITVPDHITLAQAALAEPIACGWHAVRLGQHHIAPPLPELRCMVIGGGAIGLGAALSLRAQGASNIALIEPNPQRRAALGQIKDITLHASAEDRPELLSGCDLVIDGVGLAVTRSTACACARPGGFIIHIGLGEATGGLDVRRMTLQEIGFAGTYTYTSDDFIATTQAMFDGRLGPLDWYGTRPLSDGAAAFADIRAGRSAAPKTILIPDQEDHTE